MHGEGDEVDRQCRWLHMCVRTTRVQRRRHGMREQGPIVAEQVARGTLKVGAQVHTPLMRTGAERGMLLEKAAAPSPLPGPHSTAHLS